MLLPSGDAKATFQRIEPLSPNGTMASFSRRGSSIYDAPPEALEIEAWKQHFEAEQSRAATASSMRQQPRRSSSEGALRATGARGGAKVSWDWCQPKRRGSLQAREDPEKLVGYHSKRDLTSPSTLTWEGQNEAMRVLGATATSTSGFRSMGSTGFDERPKTTSLKKLPMTCNQIYGSRAEQAEPAAKYVPKNTCDVCRFVDAMVLSKTPYNPSIRF